MNPSAIILFFANNPPKVMAQGLSKKNAGTAALYP